MPFANKYKFTMRIPEAGGSVGSFTVESVDVGHVERGDGTIDYPVSLVLVGPGGAQGVRKAVREHLDRGHTTFSGFGNPYQLRLGRFGVETLGRGRYRVTATGIGVRFDLERELTRFATYAKVRRKGASGALAALIPTYLEDYKRDATRKAPEIEY